MPSSEAIAAVCVAIRRRPSWRASDRELLGDAGPCLADVDARALIAAGRPEYEAALSEYTRVTSYLARRPIRAGFWYSKGRWLVRGEYSDIPARFVDARRPPLARTQEAFLGDVDDIATELGFPDGDALRECLRTIRRPRLADYAAPAPALPYGREDVDAVRRAIADEAGYKRASLVQFECAEAVLREALLEDPPAKLTAAIANARRQARHQAGRKAAGACMRCGSVDARTQAGKTNCQTCTDNAKAAVKASRDRLRAIANPETERIANAIAEAIDKA